jgi:hypothetical protein
MGTGEQGNMGTGNRGIGEQGTGNREQGRWGEARKQGTVRRREYAN